MATRLSLVKDTGVEPLEVMKKHSVGTAIFARLLICVTAAICILMTLIRLYLLTKIICTVNSGSHSGYMECAIHCGLYKENE